MVAGLRAHRRRLELGLRRRLRRPSPRERIVPYADGLRVWADPGDVVERQAWIAGWYERATATVLIAAIRPGDVALDIGAHVGLHTLPMAHAVGPHGLVVAFEPNPTTLVRLRRNLALNDVGDRVRVHEVAASEAPGEALLHLSDDPDNSGGASLMGQRRPARTVPVPCATVDDLLGDLAASVVVAKLDVEGHEAGALAGARAVLAARPAVVLEANGLAPLELLLDLGYGCYELAGTAPRLVPVARDRLAEVVRPGTGTNVAAVVPGSLAATRLGL